jgi:hypothetical protein
MRSSGFLMENNMAYFSNGNEGMCFDEQCIECRLGQGPCTIAWVQQLYNYRQVGNTLAMEILDNFVKDDGTCMMFKEHEKIFRLTEDEKNQLEINFERGIL